MKRALTETLQIRITVASAWRLLCWKRLIAVYEQQPMQSTFRQIDFEAALAATAVKRALTEGFLKWTTLATARRGRSTGAYRSLQMAIRGRIRGFEELPFFPFPEGSAFALSGPSFSAPSLPPLPLLPALTSFSRALMALLPSDPPAENVPTLSHSAYTEPQ